MKERLQSIRDEALKAIESADMPEKLNDVRVKFLGKKGELTAVLKGMSSDTTFYVVALYFGSIGVRNTYYTIPCSLLADLAGAIAAVAMTYLFFT